MQTYPQELIDSLKLTRSLVLLVSIAAIYYSETTVFKLKNSEKSDKAGILINGPVKIFASQIGSHTYFIMCV